MGETNGKKQHQDEITEAREVEVHKVEEEEEEYKKYNHRNAIRKKKTVR